MNFHVSRFVNSLFRLETGAITYAGFEIVVTKLYLLNALGDLDKDTDNLSQGS